MGCNHLTVWEDIITGTGQTQPNYKEAHKERRTVRHKSPVATAILQSPLSAINNL